MIKEQILALLVAMFQGVRKDGLNHLANSLALTVKTEDEAKEVVGKLTADQVKAFVTDWRKEADAEITKANQTYEAGLKTKYDFMEKKPGEGGNPTPPTPGGTLDAAAIQNIVTEAVRTATTPLLQEVATLKGNAANANRRELLVKELDGVTDSYKNSVLENFGLIEFKDEETFTGYLNGVKTNVATFKQELADKGLGQQGKPNFGTVNTDGVSAAVQSYVKDKTEGGTTLTGKEV